MLLFYFRTALITIRRHSRFSLLNVIGLTLGISSCLLIILYVNFELSYDKFHKNTDNIFRVVMKQPGNQVVGSSSDWWVVSPYILKPTWESELPEIERITRITERSWSFKYKDQYINEDILVVDSDFLDVFTFPLTAGNKKEVFTQSNSIVISQRMSQKYFGEEDPVGKSILMNNGILLSVTGVLEKLPENSHLKFNFLVSFQTLQSKTGQKLLSDNWLNNSYHTYVVLSKNVNLVHFDAKLRKYDLEGFNDKNWSFHLQPLADIHFNRQIYGTGDKGKLYIFVTIGFFILFIAGFNYVNLYISHYRTRTKSIVIRRVSGASRSQLIVQFFAESFLLILSSSLISIGIVWLALPLFNDFISEQLDIKSLLSLNVIISSFGVIILMALIAGAYPSFYLSSIKVTSGLKGIIEKFSIREIGLRKGIIIIQFSVSIILLIGTIAIYNQLNYISNKSLGYEKDHIIYMSLDGTGYKDIEGRRGNNIETLKQELLKHSNISKIAGSTGIPSKIGWSNIPIWEGQQEGNKPFFYRINVDEDFLDLYGIDILQGRNFTLNTSGDFNNSFILNETAVKYLELETPVGSLFGFNDKLGSVVGVAKDFHFESLHKPITPLGIGFTSYDDFNYFSLKINNKNIPETIKYIEKTWSRHTNKVALKYSFLDNQLDQLYKKDQQLAESMNYFSLIALLISCIGIFGLMSYTIKERTKELGIRKVLGAPFFNLVSLLTKDILLIVGFASILGGILGWYLANQWLESFAFRIQIGPDTILLSSVIALLMALIPLSFKIEKAIRKNPVESLRIDN